MAASNLSRGAMASVVLTFFMLTIMALSCAILGITNRQLYNAWTWCASTSTSTECYAALKTCWISDSPLDDMVPCSYLYALGALGLFFPMLAGTAVCLVDTYIGTLAIGLVGAVCNFVWWIAGAIYFQIKINDINDLAVSLPADQYRRDVTALLWTNMAVAAAMVLLVCFMAKEAKNARDARQEPKGKQETPEAKVADPEKVVVQAEAA